MRDCHFLPVNDCKIAVWVENYGGIIEHAKQVDNGQHGALFEGVFDGGVRKKGRDPHHRRMSSANG